MINFYLPDFNYNSGIILLLADTMERNPEWFYDDIRIASAYGAFPSSIWNGGRNTYNRVTNEEMRRTIEEFNRRGIAIRYTFTNPLLEEKHVYDTFCNLCLELANNGMNEVIVNSPILEEYVRKNFPKYKLISSTTKCLSKEALIQDELNKDYYLVVLDSAMNNTDEIFALDHKEKVELIANHFCQDNCPNRKKHYEAVGRAQLTFSKCDFPPCKNLAREFYQIMENRSFISNELIHGKYKEAGFRHFKLDGRGFPPHKAMDSFLYYLVKPEYKEIVRGILLKEIYRL